MKLIPYEQALNKLKLDKKNPRNNNILFNSRLTPSWVSGKDFIHHFLPYLTIKIDSREQDDWVKKICDYYKISNELAVKNKKEKTENLKEGDITFSVHFGNKVYDYTNIVAYERKGSACEFYNNVLADRERLENEFDRQLQKGYKKFVLMLEFGNKIDDLIDYEFSFYDRNGNLETKSCGQTVFATVSSWTQPNKYAFDLIQCDTQSKDKTQRTLARSKLFWLMLFDMYYFFKQEIRLEAQNLINTKTNEIKGD